MWLPITSPDSLWNSTLVKKLLVNNSHSSVSNKTCLPSIISNATNSKKPPIYQAWDAVFHHHFDETLRRELKIRRAAEYLWRTSRCFLWWWITVLNASYYFSNKMILKEKCTLTVPVLFAFYPFKYLCLSLMFTYYTLALFSKIRWGARTRLVVFSISTSATIQTGITGAFSKLWDIKTNILITRGDVKNTSLVKGGQMNIFNLQA